VSKGILSKKLALTPLIINEANQLTQVYVKIGREISIFNNNNNNNNNL